jgi:hypothetical protein
VIADVDRKVRDALEVWAEWVKADTIDLGYGRCMGFESGGSVGGWEDFERKVDKNMAVNVQAIYDGLEQRLQLSLDHFHLAAVWRSNRTRLEDDYADALMSVEVGLRKRGLL